MLRPNILILLTIPLLFALITFNIGCKGITGSGVSESARYESGFRSLRLGQITTANNRVATTIAIDNKESILILEPAPGSPSLTEVLYQTPDSQTVQILVGPDSLPEEARTADSLVKFSNYTDNSVTVNLTSGGVELPQQTVPLNDEIFGFYDIARVYHISPKALSTADFERIFKIGTIAVRVFGCSSRSLVSSGDSTSPFGSLTDTACSSVLATTMLNVAKVGDFEDRLVENYEGAPVSCSYDGGDFQDAQLCLSDSEEEVVLDSIVSDPEIDDVLDANFDPETGEIIPETPEPTPEATPEDSPTNSDGEASPSPSPSPDSSVPPIPDAPVPGEPEVE
jgi:hypothetical protein